MNSSSLDVFMKNYEDAANSRDFNKVQKFVSDDARSLVRRIQQEFGVTAIIVSHDPSDIFSLAEEVAVIAKGDLIQVASPKELYERPKNLKVAGSLWDINILDGKIMQSGGKYDLEITGLATVKGLIDSVEDLPGSIKVGIRPEDMVLVPKKHPLTDFSQSKNTEDVLENLGGSYSGFF